MMAAADLSRSRGVDRSTKGLFFISTLLCLICFANSLINENQLETFEEKYQEIQETVDLIKAMYRSEMASAKIMSDYITLIDPVITLIRKTNNLLPDDFPSVEKYMENIKDFMMDTKAKIDRQNARMRKVLEEEGEKLVVYQNLVKFLEEHQVELAFNSSQMGNN